MDLIFFDISEFDSPDQIGSGENMKRETLLMADRARGHCGFAWVINSGYRTPDHNKKVGGSPNSSHIRGYALDVSCKDQKRRMSIVKSAIEEGFHRIGIYKTFIHLDNDPSKAPRLWMG